MFLNSVICNCCTNTYLSVSLQNMFCVTLSGISLFIYDSVFKMIFFQVNNYETFDLVVLVLSGGKHFFPFCLVLSFSSYGCSCLSPSETLRQCDNPSQKMSTFILAFSTWLMHSLPPRASSPLRLQHARGTWQRLSALLVNLLGRHNSKVSPVRTTSLSVRRGAGQRTVGWAEEMRVDTWTKCVLTKGWHGGG